MQSRNVISAEAIIAILIQAGAIESLNYDGPDAPEVFADAGTRLDLINGDIISTAIAVDGSSGALAVRGDITAATIALLDLDGVRRVTFEPDTFNVEPLQPATGYSFDYEDPAWSDPDYFGTLGFGRRDAWPATSSIARMAAGVDANNFADALTEAIGEPGEETARFRATATRNGYLADYAQVQAQVTAALATAGYEVVSDAPVGFAGVSSFVNLTTGASGTDIDSDEVNVNNRPLFDVVRYSVQPSLAVTLIGGAPVDLVGTVTVPSAPFDRVMLARTQNLFNVAATGRNDYYITASGGVALSVRTRYDITTATSGQSQQASLSIVIPANAADVVLTVSVARVSAGTNMSTSGSSDLNRMEVLTFRSSP